MRLSSNSFILYFVKMTKDTQKNVQETLILFGRLCQLLSLNVTVKIEKKIKIFSNSKICFHNIYISLYVQGVFYMLVFVWLTNDTYCDSETRLCRLKHNRRSKNKYSSLGCSYSSDIRQLWLLRCIHLCLHSFCC